MNNDKDIELLIDANDNESSDCCEASMSNGICSECNH